MANDKAVQEIVEAAVRARGVSDGDSAGSWVIDGNTSAETALAIVKGIEDCDPAIFDRLPVLQLGEWAGDPSFEDILDDEGIEYDEDEVDDLFAIYSDGWSQGMVERVEIDARAACEVQS